MSSQVIRKKSSIMKYRIKSVMKRLVPGRVIDSIRRLKNAFLTVDKLRTQRTFARAADTPSYLDISALETLQKKYPFPPE
jgi:hypothetical protein